MQIARTSNDDPMPWVQIDGPIFLFFFSILFLAAVLCSPLVFLSRASSPLGVSAILSVMVRTGGSIRMQSESYHFAERIFSYGSSSAKSALLSHERGGGGRNVK